MKRWMYILSAVVAASVLIGTTAGGEDQNRSGPAEASNDLSVSVGEVQMGAPTEAGRSTRKPVASAPNYFMDRLSINGGGVADASSASFNSGVSVAQQVAGEASSASYQMGLGFWYGMSSSCLVILTGDVNLSTSLTSADIIYLVNFVFKSQAAPLPCEAAGDVNCSGSVTSADIIYMVNHVFKGDAAPCDVCTVIPGMWSCP